MKRLAAALVTATLLVSWGCGKSNYEQRLSATLDAMKYRQKLDASLEPAPTDAKFRDFPMYIRPPKDMALSSQFAMVAEVPQGQFDVAASFLSQSKGNLHVLGRRKAAPKAAGKNAPEPPPQRGKFKDDVVALLRAAYGDLPQLQTPNFVADKKRLNDFQRIVFNATNGNAIRVYLHGREPYEAALVFDTPAALERNTALSAARDLTLESFAVGQRAQRVFAGGASGAEGAPGGAGAGGAETTPF